MRVCEHGCDITRILNDYVLSDARFDWLIVNMSAYQENLSPSRSKQTASSFICRIIFEEYFTRATEVFFCVHIASSTHSASWKDSWQLSNSWLRLGFAQLSQILPAPLMFRWDCLNTEKVLYCLIIEPGGWQVGLPMQLQTTHVSAAFCTLFHCPEMASCYRINFNKMVFGQLFFQLERFILKKLFAAVSVKMADIYHHFGKLF